MRSGEPGLAEDEWPVTLMDDARGDFMVTTREAFFAIYLGVGLAMRTARLDQTDQDGDDELLQILELDECTLGRPLRLLVDQGINAPPVRWLTTPVQQIHRIRGTDK